MDTRRNLAKVFAQSLRASTADLRRLARRVDATADAERANALESIDEVATQLDATSALYDQAPDPAAVSTKEGGE